MKGTVNPTSYLSASDTKNQEQCRRAANLRVGRVLRSYREATRLGYHSIKGLRQMGLEVRGSERTNYVYEVEFQGRRMPVYSVQQCADKSVSPRAEVVVLQAVEESKVGVGAETDPSTTSTKQPRLATVLSFDVQNGLKAGTGQELEPKSQLQRSEGFGGSLPTNSEAIINGVEEESTASLLIPNGETDQELDPFSTSTIQPRLVTVLPFDVQLALKAGTGQELQPKSQLQRSKGSGASFQAYFPDNFEAQDWQIIKGDEEHTAVIFHQLYVFRHVHGLGADDYISFAWAYGRELIGQRTFDRLMNRLLKNGILERTEIQEDPYGLGAWLPRGQGTGLAYGYRFTNPDYRRNYSKVTITNRSLERRLKDLHDNVRYPVQKHLRRMLGEVQVEMPDDAELLAVTEGDKVKAEAARQQLRAIQDGERFFTVDRRTRRIFTNLTCLRRGARKFLRVRGKAVFQVDMPCCHLLALGHKCVEAGVRDAEEFMRYCEGDFYRQLADEGGFSRTQVKMEFTQRALNAPNRHPYQRSVVMRFFRKRWKWVAKFMWQQKSNGTATKDCPKPHNKLALALQKWEANLVIFKVCDRIRRERPECWIATIHDAVACLETDVPFVVQTMEQELKALGIVLAAGKLAGKPM